MKWPWDKDDELNVAARACIKALEVMHASLGGIITIIERLQKLDLPPVDKAVLTSTLREFAESLESGEQEKVFAEALIALEGFERKLVEAAATVH